MPYGKRKVENIQQIKHRQLVSLNQRIAIGFVFNVQCGKWELLTGLDSVHRMAIDCWLDACRSGKIGTIIMFYSLVDGKWVHHHRLLALSWIHLKIFNRKIRHQVNHESFRNRIGMKFFHFVFTFVESKIGQHFLTLFETLRYWIWWWLSNQRPSQLYKLFCELTKEMIYL